MKRYESPIMEIKELSVATEIAFTLDENTNNETGWLEGWTSDINNAN